MSHFLLRAILFSAALLCNTMIDGKRVQAQGGLSVGDVIDGLRLDEHLGTAPLKGSPADASEDTSFLEQGQQTRKNATGLGRPRVVLPRRFVEKKFVGTPQHLGAGSFGESWLVTGQAGTPYAGRQVVAKFLFIEQNKKFMHVTKKLVSANPVLRRSVKEAADECDFAKKLQEAALRMNSSIAKNAQRLMACYGHNYMKKTSASSPIYLVLENCGVRDLENYIKAQQRKNAMNAELIGSILRQILEGLQYLADMRPFPVIHHDLKPANIVVKEVKGQRFPTVHLIDFGGMMWANPRSSRASTVSTSIYAPQEWFQGYAFKEPASSFDMYGVGNILADMAIERTFGEMVWTGHRPDFGRIDSISAIKTSDEFMQLFSKYRVPGLASMGQNPLASKFIEEFWTAMIAPDPAVRPSPAEVLQSDWLQSCTAPDDGEWKMYTTPPKVEVQEEDEEEAGSEDSSGCLSVCNLCLKDGDSKMAPKNQRGPKKYRQRVVCAVELENPQLKKEWVKHGIQSDFCSKHADIIKVGRKKNGEDGAQEYWAWQCAEMTEQDGRVLPRAGNFS